MKKLITVSLVVIAAQAFACTGFYVGREVSADGTTMIGRTVDAAPWNGPMREARFERGEWTYADGTCNKYAFICMSKVTSQGKGFYGGGAINEMGVMISATVTGRTKDEAVDADPFVAIDDGGYGEPNLPDYMIGNAATAREAVEILGAMIAEKGHSGPEIYMVADSNEAWYVEVYTGHQWAAVKMPENQVAVFGNQFNIRDFDTTENPDAMCSPNLVDFAVSYDLIKWKDKDRGVIDLYKTFSPELIDYSNYRTFWGHHAWAPSNYPVDKHATDVAYPLFFDPEPGTKISLTDVFELMRARYEGVNCPDENGDTSIRVIGTTKQMSCHVLQLRHDLPTDYRCTLWECLAQAEHSTFIPVCMAVKNIPDAYSRDQQPPLEYDSARAADAFLRLDTLAELKRSVVDTYGTRQDVRACYGAGVRAFWRAQEDRLTAEWPERLAEWMSVSADKGRALATAYVNLNQVWTLAEAKRLHDELAWYWAEFNCDLRDGGGATDVPTRPFASSVPTNAETGAAWTRWHRAEFDAYIEELAGPEPERSEKTRLLVSDSKRVFDGVDDAGSVADAKSALADIVKGVCINMMVPLGCVDNPWSGGDQVIVWTNGVGLLVIEGEGVMNDCTVEAEAPWAEALVGVSDVRVAAGITPGANTLAGLPSTSSVNGLVPSAVFSALGGTTPAGEVSPAEFERIDIVDGKALLGVSVYTSDTLTNEVWACATNGVIEVPAPGKIGFYILKSKRRSE